MMQQRKVPVGVFLVMSKPNHDVLLDNFSYLGIYKDLLVSYLSNRQQCVCFDNKNSEMVQFTTGVFQGSIIGSTLCLTSKCMFFHESQIELNYLSNMVLELKRLIILIFFV